MNKTVSINLAGVFFHIDEDAYLKLQNYLKSIKASLIGTEGSSEIISDIEARISELFNERIKNSRQVIGINELDEVIAIMGQPEDYVDEDVEFFENETQKKSILKKDSIKKLFRDIDNSYIGGVASGLSHYFGIDSIWVRLIWVFLIMLSFGTFVFIYILLWFLVPSAKTTSDKIIMTGEPVNINNIEKQIKDGFDTVSDVAKNVTKTVSETTKSHEKQIKLGLQKTIDTILSILTVIGNVLTKIIGFVFVFSSTIILIALILSFFSVSVKNILNIPGIEFMSIMNTGGTSIKLALTLAFLGIGIPFLFLFYIGLKILIEHLKPIGNITKLSLFGIWLVSIIGIIVITIRETSEHSFSEKISIQEPLNISVNDTLKIVMGNNNIYKGRSYGLKSFKIANNKEGVKLIYGTDIELIIKSTSDSIGSVVLKKHANGIEYEKAIERAQNINYNYQFDHNILTLDPFLSTELENKYSNQEVEVFVYLPKGTVLEIDDNISHYNSHSSIVKKREFYNHYLKVLDNKIECLDCENRSKQKINNSKKENSKVSFEIKGDNGSLKIDENGLKIESKDLHLEVNSERVEVIEKTDNKNTLKKIKYTDASNFDRLEHVRSLKYQDDIKKVAYTDKDPKIRLEALRKLKYQDAIKQVAYTDKDPNIRLEALRKLKYQDAIKQIAYTDTDPNIRLEALRKLKYQDAIKQVAYTDKDPKIRLEALRKLKYQDDIKQVAYRDKDTKIRHEALKLLN